MGVSDWWKFQRCPRRLLLSCSYSWHDRCVNVYSMYILSSIYICLIDTFSYTDFLIPPIAISRYWQIQKRKKWLGLGFIIILIITKHSIRIINQCNVTVVIKIIILSFRVTILNSKTVYAMLTSETSIFLNN